MNIGFIGFGKSTNRYHLPFVDIIDDLKVVGFYKQGANVFDMPYELDYDIKRYNSTHDLYKDCELVVICTPAKYHYEYAKEALINGKHVLVEKPLCESLEEAKELFELAESKNLVISPYQNRRFDSDFLTIKEIITNPKYDLGEIFEIESNHTHYRPDRSEESGSIYDGSVFGHAVHFIDQIVSLYGEPDDIIYDITNQKLCFIDSKDITGVPEDFYDLRLIYKNMRVRIRFSQLVIKEPPRWIINSTKATVEKYYIDQQERDLKLGIFLDNKEFGKDIKNTEATIYKQNETIKVDTIYKNYSFFYKELIDAIRNNCDSPVRKDEALIVLNIMETIVLNKPYKKLTNKKS